MKNRIITLALFVIVAVSSFLLGTTQAKTVTEVKEIEKVVKVVPNGYVDTTTYEFFNNFLDMRTVVDFDATENGLELYTNDGNGYYWER